MNNKDSERGSMFHRFKNLGKVVGCTKPGTESGENDCLQIQVTGGP